MQENWFKDWFNSPYYHILYKNRDENEAMQLIDKLISHLNLPKHSKIVDVACGKGRHAIHLAEYDFDVTGIDLSEESIEEALLSEKENLHFYTHDMRLPFWINYFNYAFNFFTSFGYFKTNKENENAIRTISQSLVKGGSFIIDYINTDYATSHIVHSEEKNIDGIHFSIIRWHDDHKFYKKIIIDDPAVSNSIVFVEEVQKFTSGDFETLFKMHGLHIKSIFGNYDFSKYDALDSPRMIIVAEKLQ
jgi:SAM-dependent methyltransferase